MICIKQCEYLSTKLNALNTYSMFGLKSMSFTPTCLNEENSFRLNCLGLL